MIACKLKWEHEGLFMETNSKALISQSDDSLAQQVQDFWERSWSRSSYNPTWVLTEIPKELREAVENKWFIAGSSILDIGCGSGELSAWLAERNFKVHGIDCSQTAIDRAKNQYHEMTNRLTFQVVDICRDVAPTPQYDALFDRGCLQGLPKALHSDYITTVASWANRGARFLLLYGLHREVKRTAKEVARERKKLREALELLCANVFEINDISKTVIKRRDPHDALPGLAVWMTRL